MIKFSNTKTRFINLLIALCLLVNIFGAPIASAASEPGAAGATKTLIPRKISSEIYKHTGRILKQVCSHLSKIEGWRVELYSELLDDQNRMFFAVKGTVCHKWPFKDIDKNNVLKVQTDGNIIIDFFINEMSSKNDVVTYEFKADAVVMLDSLAISLSKFAVGLAAAAAVEFAANNLMTFLENIDSKPLADALAGSVSDFSKNCFKGSFEKLADGLKEYEVRGDVYKMLIRGIRNGNFFSFLVFNIINVSSHQAANLAGATLGSLIGTALFPGAGTIIGGLATKAATLIITKFVINKIGSEWYFKLQLAEFIHLSKKYNDAAGAQAIYTSKMKKSLDGILEKLKDDFSTTQLTKINTLIDYINDGDAKEIIHLKPAVEGINSFMQSIILDRNDIVVCRKYYQLKKVIVDRGMEKSFGY